MSWRLIICASVFVTCLLTANTIATKLITVGGVVLTAAIVIFPLSYVLGDVLTAVWGYATARRVMTLAFAGTVPARALGAIIVAQWAVKVAYEAAATPLTYATVAYLKASEHVDAYDYGTDFNPIRL